MISRERELSIVAFSQKNPLPNEVEGIARKYAYASQKDLPQLQDSPELRIFHRKKELMDIIDGALPELDTDALLGLGEEDKCQTPQTGVMQQCGACFLS